MPALARAPWEEAMTDLRPGPVAGPTTDSVTSADGTTLGYHQLGQGPGLVLVHGAMESARSHLQLAEALADSFTVYLPDRRGRGRSGGYDDEHHVHKDVEDLGALLAKTGTHRVFGVSSGALICLQAALMLPAVRKVALFEPPLSVDGSVPTTWLTRFDEEIAQGRVSAALVTGMRAARMGPSLLRAMPRPFLEFLTAAAMRHEERKAAPDDVTMRLLAPTLHHDFQWVAETAETLDSYADIRADVLLLGGSRSPAYLRSALDALETTLPRAERVEFAGLGHGASGNADRGGQPVRVARELRRFFV